jgi:hypothetical protein
MKRVYGDLVQPTQERPMEPDKIKLREPMHMPIFKIEYVDRDSSNQYSSSPNTTDVFRTNPHSRVNFHKLSRKELKERCIRQLCEIQQLKKKVKASSLNVGASKEISKDEITLLAASEMMRGYGRLIPERERVLVDIADVILNTDLLLRGTFIGSLSELINQQSCLIPESKHLGAFRLFKPRASNINGIRLASEKSS